MASENSQKARFLLTVGFGSVSCSRKVEIDVICGYVVCKKSEQDASQNVQSNHHLKLMPDSNLFLRNRGTIFNAKSQ